MELTSVSVTKEEAVVVVSVPGPQYSPWNIRGHVGVG
jgi:hypothetical protein